MGVIKGLERREEGEAGYDHQVVIVGSGEDSSWHRTASLLSEGSARGVQTSG